MPQYFESALPLGGSIAARRADGRWLMTCEEARLTINQPLWRHLAAPSPADKIMPAHVQFALLAACATQAARPVLVTQKEQTLKMTL
jgi:hypothetical protein